jgi:hypothetical protein
VTTLANRFTPRWSFQASLAGMAMGRRSEVRLSADGVITLLFSQVCFMGALKIVIRTHAHYNLCAGLASLP